MLDLIMTGQYKKDCRRMEKRGYDMTRLDAVVEMLRIGEKLPENTMIIICVERTTTAGNVTLNLTGF